MEILENIDINANCSEVVGRNTPWLLNNEAL